MIQIGDFYVIRDLKILNKLHFKFNVWYKRYPSDTNYHP